MFQVKILHNRFLCTKQFFLTCFSCNPPHASPGMRGLLYFGNFLASYLKKYDSLEFLIHYSVSARLWVSVSMTMEYWKWISKCCVLIMLIQNPAAVRKNPSQSRIVMIEILRFCFLFGILFF